MQEKFQVAGMHCRSCEILIENEVKKVPGVKKVNASANKKAVYVHGDFDKAAVEKAISAAGYEVGEGSQVTSKWKDLFLSVFIVLGLYFTYNAFGLDRLFGVGLPQGPNYGMIILIGLTAGFSTCMALVGGLVLSVSARYAEEHPELSPIQKFRPHLFFNAGRIIGYFLLGGLLGLLGGFLNISISFYGYLMMFAGLFMFFLGLKIIEIFPNFSNFLTLPKGLRKLLGNQDGKEYSHFRSVLLGASTFILPCGFTQAMQVLAITSSNFLSGALIMGLFAIGTAPGLLSVGGLVSVIKRGRFYGLFMKTVGILVIVFSFFNIGNGWRLAGINLVTSEPAEEEYTLDLSSKPISGPVDTNVQLIKATYTQNEVLTPREFKVRAGKPVRMEIFAKEEGLGCMGSVMIPGLVNQPQGFYKDETVVMEFTPKKMGTYRITCAMGVPAGKLKVE